MHRFLGHVKGVWLTQRQEKLKAGRRKVRKVRCSPKPFDPERSSLQQVAARFPSPPGGASARPRSSQEQRGRHRAGEEAMGAPVAGLLLVQLLVRVEPDMLGEMPAP